MMTRNHSDRSNHSSSPLTTPTADNIVNLPDLSAFQDDEKQHILDVLIRDEDLRQKHLARFFNLRREVANLEQQSQSTSTSICARCQTPFGYIFNTGDACPKCTAKVCKQCRLMYNVNDNSWLCQLCCKQMQMMSYSGEWIYALHSNLRKDSVEPSDTLNESLPPSISVQNIHMVSSSDSEPEDIPRVPQKLDRFNTQSLPVPTSKPKAKPKNPINAMIVQNPSDLQKLSFLKERIKDRPLNAAFTQPLPRRTPRPVASLSKTVNTPTEETNSLSKSRQDNRSVSHDREVPKTNQTEDKHSKLNDDVSDKKSKKKKLKVKQHSQPSARHSKLSLISNTTASTARERVSLSMQSLRDAVHRIPHPHISSSRVSLNVEKNHQIHPSISSEDAMSLKVPSISSRTNSHTNLPASRSFIDEQRQSTSSSNSNRLDSTETTDSQLKFHNLAVIESDSNRENEFTPLEYQPSVAESEDDIDRKFEKIKSIGSSNRSISHNLTKRIPSFLNLRGSHTSLNSNMSETKARYELEITGTIQIKLSYNTNINTLDIFIKKCTNLAQSKRHSTSNPYCKTYLLPDKSKGSKRKTSVKNDTVDPVFNETLRYYLSLQEFDSRTVWISVWSEASLSHNDFLGEIHIPLANSRLDNLQEYTLLPQVEEENVMASFEPTTDTSELYFELTLLEHPKKKDLGTIQVNAIHGSGISHGKNPADVVCKGVLMPDKIKRKLPIVRKGPSPKWDIPLRWENISREKLKNTSIEISFWHQERFRKTMISFIRLHAIQGRAGNRLPKAAEATPEERAAWEKFQRQPTAVHRIRLPLRPAIPEHQ